jgi:hypothetical protein
MLFEQLTTKHQNIIQALELTISTCLTSLSDVNDNKAFVIDRLEIAHGRLLRLMQELNINEIN